MTPSTSSSSEVTPPQEETVLDPPLPKYSISEQASAASSRRLQAPACLQWIEIPFRIKNPNTNAYLEEATAQAMDFCSRGPLLQSATFVGSAVLYLAAIEAGGFNESVHGIKVSNLLSVGSLISGVAAGVSMPFVGAIVDHTNHRKAVGAISAFVVTATTGAKLILSQDTWFIVFVLGVIMGYFFIMHQVCVMAYLPDLTHDVTEMGHYASVLTMKQYLVQGLFTIPIVAVSRSTDMTNIQTATFSVGFAFALAVILLGYSWLFLFRKRPKLREIPSGQNIITTGFLQLWKTTNIVFRKYRALKWFMIALLWSPEAGSGTIQAIAVTFLTLFVKMSVAEISVVSLVMIFCTVPGAFISRYMCRKINPLNSFRAAQICFAAQSALTAITVTGPDKKHLIYFYGGLLGLSCGWMFPSQRTTVVALIPKGQETEIMGLVSFFGQIIGWLPVLVFTVMNERGVSMRWGASILCYFLLASFLCTLMCGDFSSAVAKVAHTSDAYLEEFARNSATSRGNRSTLTNSATPDEIEEG